LGNQQFFGTGLKVNTQKPFTVITRFITNDGTPTGTLSEIQRIYVQNGVVIQNSVVNVPGVPAYSSITNQYCAAEKAAFGDQDTFTYEGGLLELDSWMSRGMVLAMGIGDDRIPGRNMNWLDSNYPASADPSTPGVSRGPCAVSAGTPAIVEAEYAAAAVVFSNIKYGPIGSTATSIGPQTPNTVAHYGQCGGTGLVDTRLLSKPQY
jgi:cellulose 1,4-beta-cellobiosidase